MSRCPPIVTGFAIAAMMRIAFASEAEGELPDLPSNPARYQHGLSFIYPLEHPVDFEHFRYVNPDAPKGGTMRIAMFGSYDTFTDFLDKGQGAAGIGFTGYPNLLYDRLLEPALDEPASQYGRLAEGVTLAEDSSWVAFKLRSNPRWHDGEPIDFEDFEFTFQAIKDHGAAELKSALRDVVAIERIGEREFRYLMRDGAPRDPAIPLMIGRMAVLPKHFWASRDVSRTQVNPPLGSGPYRVRDHALGRSITYERVEDYWGRDLPVNRGRFNFDVVRFEFFRDDHVRREAQTSGAIDVAHEGVAKNWANEYRTLPAVLDGWLKQELLPIANPAGLWFAVVWNLRLERFQDPRVREALTLLYDFEFINRTLSYGFYNHGRSVFQNSPMEATGLPSAAERRLLDPFREQLPERVFGPAYQPPPTSGFGRNRDHVLRALELFAAAGWEITDGAMRHVETGEPFRISFVVVSKGLIRTLMPYQDTLKRIGIETTAVAPEVSNWLHRMRTRKFDAAMRNYTPSHTPGLQLVNYFGSASANQAYGGNWGGLEDPVVDALIDAVLAARTAEDFLAATHALDRVLLWNFYMIPRSSPPGYRLVHWDRYGRPPPQPLLRHAYLDTWWFDEERSARVDEGIRSLDR